MATSDEMREWVARVLGVRLEGQPAAARSESDAPPPLEGMAAWSAARAEAIAALRDAESIVRDYVHPDSDRCMIELRAIRANLTAEPKTPQQVDELETYIRTDDVVADAEGENGLGIRLSLRAPLLAALAGLRAGLGTAGEARR